VENLRLELANEERRKATELTRLEEQIAAEKQRNGQRPGLEKEAGEKSIKALGEELAQFGSQRSQAMRAAEEQKRAAIRALNRELREMRKQCQTELNAQRFCLLAQIQEQERHLQASKQKLAQAQIDTQCEALALEAAKEQELAQLQIRQQTEIECLTIDLQAVQAEAAYLTEYHSRRMAELADLRRDRAQAIKGECESQKAKIDNASRQLLLDKERLTAELKVAIRDYEAEMKGGPEDAEHIARLEEIARERREAVEQLIEEYKRCEAAMLESEASFNRLASGQGTSRSESAPSMLDSVGGKRLRKEGLTLTNRRVPTVIEPATLARKNRTPV
jgi:hypothetical protein